MHGTHLTDTRCMQSLHVWALVEPSQMALHVCTMPWFCVSIATLPHELLKTLMCHSGLLGTHYILE